MLYVLAGLALAALVLLARSRRTGVDPVRLARRGRL